MIASALGSMPIGMFGLAILLLAQDATGSFAVAGRVVGAFGIGNALGAVAQGRLMDRLGQTRVLRTAAVVHALACAALVVAAHEGAPARAAVRVRRGAAGSPSPSCRRRCARCGARWRATRSSARRRTRWSRSSSRSR